MKTQERGRLPFGVRAGDAAREIVDWFLPPVCLCCASPLDTTRGDFLCARCRGDLRGLEPPACGCGQGKAPTLAERAACDLCSRLPTGVMTMRAAYPYGGVVGDIVRNLKYRHAEAAGDALARMTLGALSGHLTLLRDGRKMDMVAAVPMHWTRRLARGYNQADCIARPLATLLGVEFDADAIARVKRTPPQARKTKAKQRLANVKGAFDVLEPERVKGRCVLLVDDVMTTGATIATCGAAMIDAGAAEVHAVTVTRAGLQ